VSAIERPIQPSVQWIPEVNLPEHDADHHLHVIPRHTMLDLYMLSLLNFHGIVLN
jgi:hypothetical protein